MNLSEKQTHRYRYREQISGYQGGEGRGGGEVGNLGLADVNCYI